MVKKISLTRFWRGIICVVLCAQFALSPLYPSVVKADSERAKIPQHSDPYSPFNPLVDGVEGNPEGLLFGLEERFSEEQLDELLHEFSRALAAQGDKPFVFDRFHLLAQTVNQKLRDKIDEDGQKIAEPVLRYIPHSRLFLEFVDVDRASAIGEPDSAVVRKVSFDQLSRQIFECAGGCFFRFVLGNGEVLHEFRVPIEWMARVGDMLVWKSRWYSDRLSMLNLKTFHYNVGNSDIPVFDIPFPFLNQIQDKRARFVGTSLRFAPSYSIAKAQLQDISRIYESLYFMTANFLDPQRLAEFHYLSRSLMQYVEGESLKGRVNSNGPSGIDLGAIESDMRSILARQNQALGKGGANGSHTQDVLNRLKERADAQGEAFKQAIAQQEVVEKNLRESLETYSRGQKFSGKLKQLLATMIAPNTRAAELLEGSMVGVMAKLKQTRGGESAASIMHWITRHPTMTASSIAMAAVTLSAPDSVAIFLKQGLDSLNFVYEPVWEMIKGTSLLVWQSTVDTTAILVNTKDTVRQQYFDNGNWWRLMVGLTALTGALIVVIGGYHTLATTTRLVRDRMTGKMVNLVERQERIFATYYDMLARSEEARRLSDREKNERTGIDEQTREGIREKIRRVEEEEANEQFRRSQLWHRRAGRLILSPVRQGISLVGRASSYTASVLGLGNVQNEENRYVKTQWQALSSLIFSYASYTRSVLDLVKFWNGFSRFRYSVASWGFIEIFGLRLPAYVKPHPQVLMYQIAYPYFFREAVVKGEGKAVPSVLNGGMTPLWELVMRWGGRFAGELDREEVKHYHHAVEQFEEHIIKVEKEVVPEITLAAIEALGGFIKNDRDIRLLYSAASVTRISEPILNRLSTESQRFVRVYYELLYRRIMSRLLREHLKTLPPEEIANSLRWNADRAPAIVSGNDPARSGANEEILEIDESEVERLAIDELKDIYSRYRLVTGQLPEFEVERETLRSWIHEEVRRGVEKETLEVIEGDRRLLGEVKRKYATLAIIDPQQNGSFKRYATVQKNSQDPVALARAIKFEISQMLVTLPVKIGVKLLASAGIYEGLYRPIQETMFGENSVFYLSQMSFYNGVLFGVFISLLANSWYKIQENAFHDENGELGIVPRDEDAKKSYFRWFMKMSFGKKNSLVLNYQRYATLIFWNIPAALILYGVFQPLFLGRIDIEAILAGYAVGYLTPADAFRMKMEQGFERSAYYDGRHFTEQELASSEVQRFMESRIQKRRNRFNLITDFFMDWVDNWATNIFFVPREGLGPRAFFRQFFAGWLPTEILVDRMRFVTYKVADVPVLNTVVSSIAGKCEMLFSRGNPDLIRIK